ncbi:hypothetical protein BCR39DRAFT_471127 [Naematelia encephala]|uniref:Small-subunit processome Utp12 domain-containing protein n=1 Tax=Naematelia encephala TaxID=71784 RepID=A0A1Y2AT34_9TREE|nr:hypothetical protein BCR39DRAFT_471127 [Naematelia encephala]
MAPKQPVAGPSRLKSAAPAAVPPSPSVSGFNSSRTQFALALPVLGSADKITVWNVADSTVAAYYEVEGASKVTSLTWSWSDASSRKRKRQKHNSDDHPTADGKEVIVLTTAKQQVIVFSPTQHKALQIFDLPGKVTAACVAERGHLLVTSKAILRLSDDLTSISHTFPLPRNTQPLGAIAVLPTQADDSIHVVAASLSASVLHLSLSDSKVTYASSSLPVSTLSVTSIVTLPSTPAGASFLVASEEDRTVSQYTITSPQQPPKLSYRYASPTLSPVHSLSISDDRLAVLHISGEVSLFPLPEELDFARPKSDSKPSTLQLNELDGRIARLCRAEFAQGPATEPRSLWLGRMAGGARLTWQRVAYESSDGTIKSEIKVKVASQDLKRDNAQQITSETQRYKAPTATLTAPPDAPSDSSAALPTDVHLADLSLGERLLALPNGAPQVNGSDKPKPADDLIDGPVNAASLTRLLVQALHTSDPALLNVCLNYRDPKLIRNTIRKMPPQMALPLLKACVERLGQGKGANTRGGGRGVGQNEQQGRGTVAWVKGVLVERGALLMTMPSLPVHLAQLSSLLATRLQLHQPLLNLSGRLDLALAQIQMRRLAAEQSQASIDGTSAKSNGVVYVEGESEDEEEDEEVAVEVGEDGEIEDVDMRGIASSEDESDDDDDDDDEDLLESGSENELIDVEAEESDEEGESGSEDE